MSKTTVAKHITTGEERAFICVIVPDKPYRNGQIKARDATGQEFIVDTYWWKLTVKQSE